jgi:type VI secretion system secreted protein VgrG
MKTAAFTQANRPLQITTPLGRDALLLVGLSGREAVSELYRFDLDLLADKDRKIEFDKVLGQPVNVGLTLGNGKVRYFGGLVSKFTQGEQDEDFTRYRAEVVPAAWMLSRVVQSRVFQHKSVPEILKEVLVGFPVTFAIHGAFHPRNYCVQYRESDFAFAARLMEDEGIAFFFKHTADGHEMVVTNSGHSHPEVPEIGKALYETIAGGVKPEARITHWEKSQEVRSGKVTLWDHSFELPGKQLDASKQALDEIAIGKEKHRLKLAGGEAREIYEYPGGYAARFDGIDAGGGERPNDVGKFLQDNERVATIRMQQEAMAGLRARGKSTCRQLTSGHTFALERHFNADGAYLLTEVEHTIAYADNFRTGEGPTLTYDNTFGCIPKELPFRPARSTRKPRVDGAQTAVVVGPRGEEIFTDKYGRVKVQFLWDREGRMDENSSCWVRVATPWAGAGWGAIHIPRIGQEVVVDFLEGDPDRPLIMGSVFNANVMPPFELPAGKRLSGFKTNSTPTNGGSNELTFDDTKGKEKVNLHAQFDMAQTVDNDLTVTVHNNRTTTIDVNSTETVLGKKETTVNGTVLETYNSSLSTVVKGGVMLASTGANIHVVAATEVMLNSGASTLLLKSDGTIELTGVNIVINGKALVDVAAPSVTVAGGETAVLGVGSQTVLCDAGQVAVSGAAIVSAAEGTHDIKGALVKIN